MNPHPHELAPLLVTLGTAGIELARYPAHGERLGIVDDLEGCRRTPARRYG